MSKRRKNRREEAQVAFEALLVEGGLIAPEWLAKIARLEAGTQAEADYRVPRGLNLRDEIGRFWRIAQALWDDFAAGRASRADAAVLSHRFVVDLLRLCFGFDSLTPVAPVVVGDRTWPIGHAALGGRVPVVVAPAGFGLDALSPAFGDTGRRRSAFGLAQEHLNATEGALWGMASDGLTLRILRDNASLTRPAWIEADLERLFTEERYADFAAVWLLIHESRFGRADSPATDCPLETWREAGREQGTRARDRLRQGVEVALVALGEGFLKHPDNGALRAALESGAIQDKDYFNQLLRLVYRLIFLLTVEERGLLHPDDTPDTVRRLYADGYGLRRLRERSVKRGAHDRFPDQWESVKVIFRSLTTGEPRLGLPALAGLFAANQCPALDAAKLENRALLTAMYRLSWLKEASGLTRVNWRDMGPEELGSVYESLLELVPQVSVPGRSFGFAGGDAAKGNARKTSGSYYTPDSLVQVLLESALEPVIKETAAANPSKEADALLKLSIVDPACGSGHFLLAAARRLAGHVARYQARGTPTAPEYRRALRQVVGHCIYGVDLNPMAVELCKVALWMEAVEPGLPLTFLDAHIRQGNALLGATPELMAKGIPDAAWEPIEGDDKAISKRLKARNKTKQLSLFAPSGEGAVAAPSTEGFEAEDDGTLEGLRRKEEAFARWVAQSTDARLLADVWCSAFVWPKNAGEAEQAAPVRPLWAAIKANPGAIPAATRRIVGELREQYSFFHWYLAFPKVHEAGGFDVVLGNPPWERVKIQEQEFFAERDPEIAGAANAAARKKRIAALPEKNPALWEAWCKASREAEGQSFFARTSGRFPLCGQGDINTYALFAEHNKAMMAGKGRAGIIVPTGIATDATTQHFFGDLVGSSTLGALFGFENEGKLFRGVDHRVNFCLLVMSRAAVPHGAEFGAFLRHPDVLRDPDRRYRLSSEDIAHINPNTHTCPVFKTRRDAEITKAIYERVPVLWRDGPPEENIWTVTFRAMFHMANDSGLFQTRAALLGEGWRFDGNLFCREDRRMLPLYEAKMVTHYDHRYGDFAKVPPGESDHILPQVSSEEHADPSFVPLPRYWVAEEEVDARLGGTWDRGWLLGWRDVTDARSSVRTVVAAIMPRRAIGHTIPLFLTSHANSTLLPCLYANLSSFVLDYVGRQKIGGVHLTYGYLNQFPILPPSTYSVLAPWARTFSRCDWLLPRVLELTYTAWDLEPFAHDCGYDGPPFRWDPARRFLLRCELDAAFFHLYSITRDDVDYIMDTFPIVRKNEEKAHGEYRTKRVILDIYDAIAEATRTGIPYATRLDPPPADPRVAHALRGSVTGAP